jgi:hypothetical protein
MRNIKSSHNLLQLEAVATALGDLLADVVFVGGSTTILVVDENATGTERRTKDTDCIVNITTRQDYHKFCKKLRERGFKEDTREAAPICRFVITDTVLGELIIDVMPINEEVLGFSNRWYSKVMETAQLIQLNSSLQINVIDPIYFLATKFEAFSDRGNGDFFSHDMEDIVYVFEHNSRISILFMETNGEVRAYISEKANMLLKNQSFMNILPGLLDNQNSRNTVINTLRIIARG